MSSRRDREKKEERQNQSQPGGWAGAPNTWADNSPAPSPIGGGTKTATGNSGQPVGYVRDNPGQTNYREPVGAGWDKGASATSLSSMGDQKTGGPNHVVVGNQADTKPGPDTGNNDGTRPDPVGPTNIGPGSNPALGGMHTGWYEPTGNALGTSMGPISNGNTADQSPQWRRVTSPNTGLLPTLSPKTVTSVQPKAATATKEDRPTCKARPKDNRPKGGGGGGNKRFVPWC